MGKVQFSIFFPVSAHLSLSQTKAPLSLTPLSHFIDQVMPLLPPVTPWIHLFSLCLDRNARAVALESLEPISFLFAHFRIWVCWLWLGFLCLFIWVWWLWWWNDVWFFFFFLCGFDGCDGGDGGGLLAMVVVWFFNFLFSMGLVAVVVMVVVVVDWWLWWWFDFLFCLWVWLWLCWW